MRLTSDDIRTLLHALCPEGGYSKDPKVAKLQAKLSVMLEAAEVLETKWKTGAK